MEPNRITLFVLPDCQVCPVMERLFEKMHQNGEIDEYECLDISEHAEQAEAYNIRSVPFYLINGVSFTGLRSHREISGLLGSRQTPIWRGKISDELSDGQLASVTRLIRGNAVARQAMLELLADNETELVVRIGLTAVIESLAGSGVLADCEAQLIRLTEHANERIALDALYYLSLLATPASVQTLESIALNGRDALRMDAEEMLTEFLSAQKPS